jgi:hypothetical protein
MTKASLRQLAAIGLVFLLAVSQAQATRKHGHPGCSVHVGDDLNGTPLAGNLGGGIDEAILTEGDELSKLLGVNPAIFYLQEKGGPDARADSTIYADLLQQEGRTSNCCPDGTVLIGLSLLKSEWYATGGTSLSMPAIIAHEYAHIAQFKYKFPWQEGKWPELHADFIAGWFIAHRGRFPVPNNAYQAAASLYYKGDYDFNEPDHHGTPTERLAAFRAGFEFNLRSNVPSGSLAYQAGIDYLNRCKACGQ